MNTDSGSGPALVWDPFEGQRPFERSVVAVPGRGWKAPGWLGTAFGLLCVVAAGVILGALIWKPLAWIGGALLAVGVGGMLLIDTLGKSAPQRDWRFGEVARRNGWAFRLIPSSFTTKAGGRRKMRVMDPVAARASAGLGELCRPRAGQMIPLVLQAIYWGTLTLRDGPARGDTVPFWLGLQEYDVDASLGSAAMKTDAFAHRGTRGKLYMVAAAYDLARDTGITARLLAEPWPSEGWNDLKTESTQFNEAFHITLASQNGAGDEGRLALLRVLTPATQATLLDLHQRYRIQLRIERRTVFLVGQDRLMSEDDAEIAAHLADVVENFAMAALALKPYAE